MSEEVPRTLSTAERKKKQRNQRQMTEKLAGRELDALATDAIEKALELAPEVADAPNRNVSDRALDIELGTLDAARFVQKRVNAALAIDEWTHEVVLWLWQAELHQRSPLTESGERTGIELRLEQAPTVAIT